MPKLLFSCLFLLILLSLTGCNLPASAPTTPDELATQVAFLLTSPPSLQITPTIQSSNQETEIPINPELPTLTTEITGTAEPTLEPSPTSTNISLDLPQGNSTWSDPFVDGTRFGINTEGYDDGQTRIIISEGSMVLTSITASGWRGWRLTSQKPSNYYLKADFTTSECSGSDQYGLVIQSPDYASGSGYYFGLTCDGRFAFQKWDENGLENLQGWDTDTNIRVGSDQNNSLGVMKNGNQYHLYVNDVKITEIEDDKYSTPGYFGPFIAGVNTANFTIKMNNIEYWNLP